jgi:phosphatidylinositol alpha-1,6-mannosyltransferase
MSARAHNKLAPERADSLERRSKPRLLLVTPDFPPARGGIQVLAHRLAVGLGGFETRVLALDSEGARRYDAASGIATRRVPAISRPGAARNLALNAATLAEATRSRPDVILSAHIVASPAAAVVRRLHGAPMVQYFYANEILDKPRLAAFAARQADRTIAISAYTASLLATRGAPAARVSVIPPGVDLPAPIPSGVDLPAPIPSGVDLPTPIPLGVDLPASIPLGVDLPADPRSEFQPPTLEALRSEARRAERPTILTIARLQDRYKGHDVLIEALARVRAQVQDVEWVVIGDGPLRAELELLARSAGVADAVRFLGSLSDEQRDRWLRRADLFAMPSRLPGGHLAGEGFGIVYLEAAAYGKPVLAGNVGGALDAVADGESGLLVDPTDPEAVACAIVRLLLDRELARRLGAVGAERARRFAWPMICERVEALLFETFAAAPPVGR